MHTIVIVGGGFSGTALAVNLLRRAQQVPLKLVLVERRAEAGKGVAYGTRSPAHLLNVPAGRMSLLPGDEGDFLRFAAARDASVAGGSFLPRSLYGEYLSARLEEAAAAATGVLERVQGGAVALRPDASRPALALADGRVLEADRMVIASGNAPPGDPAAVADIRGSACYVSDPWAQGALDVVPLDRPALLIGTGLTMLDVALELKRRGMTADMLAVSRRGLLPQAHRHHHGPTLEPAALMQQLRAGRPGVRRYLRVLRLAVAELSERSVDWRDVIGALRPFTAELWHGLDGAERRRFIRHLQPWWDVHRHRAAPEVAEAIRHLVDTGRLQVDAGRFTRIESMQGGSAARVIWRSRRHRTESSVEAGSVINCTGPQADLRRVDDALVRDLLDQGLMQRDPLAIGVQVDALGALRDAKGRVSERFFYIGPLLRARDWECTAVPELRVMAERLAEHLAAGAREQAGG